LAVNKWFAPDYSFAGIESAVWTGCYWTAGQIIQLGDCRALCGRRDLNEDIPRSSRRSGDVCSYILAEKTSLAAAFNTDCKRFSWTAGAPANTVLQ